MLLDFAVKKNGTVQPHKNSKNSTARQSCVQSEVYYSRPLFAGVYRSGAGSRGDLLGQGPSGRNDSTSNFRAYLFSAWCNV